MLIRGGNMRITYKNNQTREVVILSERDGCMRVAVQGSEDVARFMIAGDHAWISEDGETVRVEYAWERHATNSRQVLEADFICPPELASSLVEWLYDDSALEEEAEVESAKALAVGAYHC